MKKFLLWLSAFIITVFLAYYQRVTGPTYPVKGKAMDVAYNLPRTHNTGKDACFRIKSPYEGKVLFRHHGTSEPWKELEMKRGGDFIIGCLPSQPPAGKIDYMVFLRIKGEEHSLRKNPVTIRFKGEVPLGILITHILIIFFAMLFASRAGLEAIFGGNLKPYVCWTFYLFLLGALVLGPIVQKYAFGVFWSGFPLGHDLTDTKVLVPILFWLFLYIRALKGKLKRKEVFIAWAFMLIVFLIPHSLLGSELKYTNPPE